MKRILLLHILACCQSLYAQQLEEKVTGMLLGSAIGDAAGAPYEFFYPAQRSKWSVSDLALTKAGIDELGNRFQLIDHFRKASSFAQWQDYATKGSVTDDTRFKIIFINMLRHGRKLNADNLAREILAFSKEVPSHSRNMCNDWLKEIQLAADWQLGQREKALPADRLWAGTPGIAGQMALIPLAAIGSPDLETIYKRAWELDFLDNGMARDINAAIITGLAAALQPKADWSSVEQAMRSTDPYEYGDSRYGERKLTRWLDLSHAWVRQANGNVARLFELMEAQLEAEVWWECWVPLAVVFACAEIADFQPLAAMQLCIEFGHDTDSYAQLMGAFMGALHGPGIFPKAMANVVRQTLKKDFNQDIAEWTALLLHHQL